MVHFCGEAVFALTIRHHLKRIILLSTEVKSQLVTCVTWYGNKDLFSAQLREMHYLKWVLFIGVRFRV